MFKIEPRVRVVHAIEHRAGEVLAVFSDKNHFRWAVVDWDLRLDPPEVLLESMLNPEQI